MLKRLLLVVLALCSAVVVLAQPRIRVSQERAALGEEIVASFYLENVSFSYAYSSVTGRFYYDDSMLELVEIDVSESIMNGKGQVLTSEGFPGTLPDGTYSKINFTYFGANEYTETGLLARIRFKSLAYGETQMFKHFASVGDFVLEDDRFDGGQLRVFSLPNAPVASSPSIQQVIDLEGSESQVLRFSWEPSVDQDGDPIRYELEISEDASFFGFPERFSAGAQTYIDVPYSFFRRYFTDAGLTFGDELRLYYRITAFDLDGSVRSEPQAFDLRRGVFTSLEDVQQLPNTLSLLDNYPNPFNPTTTLTVALEQSSDIRLDVLNLQGTVVQSIHQGRLGAGLHRFTFDATQLPSGMYLQRLQTNGLVMTKKMMLIK